MLNHFEQSCVDPHHPLIPCQCKRIQHPDISCSTIFVQEGYSWKLLLYFIMLSYVVYWFLGSLFVIIAINFAIFVCEFLVMLPSAHRHPFVGFSLERLKTSDCMEGPFSKRQRYMKVFISYKNVLTISVQNAFLYFMKTLWIMSPWCVRKLCKSGLWIRLRSM